MKKDLVALVLTIICGVAVYWLTLGMQAANDRQAKLEAQARLRQEELRQQAAREKQRQSKKASAEAERSQKVPAVQPTYMSELEGRTNRQGSDLSNVGILVKTAEECSRMCVERSSCMAMTFVKSAAANGGDCWLKRAVPNPTREDWMMSSYKVIP